MIIHITPKTNDGFRAIEENSIYVGFFEYVKWVLGSKGFKKKCTKLSSLT